VAGSACLRADHSSKRMKIILAAPTRRLVRVLNFSYPRPHPGYFITAGSECQEIAYAGLCEDLRKFSAVLRRFFDNLNEDSRFRVRPPRIRWR